MKRQTLVAILLAMSLATSVAFAQKGPIKFQIPEDIGMPWYARIAGATPLLHQEIYHNDDWAAIVFYFDPGSVPVDFNLLMFYDFSLLFGPKPPMTVAGFVVWDPEIMAAGGPWFQENIHGLGAVPVWFVSWPDLQIEIADGELYISEIAAMPSLRKGTAALYQEVLHPEKHITINAEGLLEDGERFIFHATGSGTPPPDCCYGPKIQIRIW